MKQQDVAIILIIAFVSAVGSFFVSNKLFVTAENRAQQAEVVDAISATFDKPSTKYFNPDSINPTQESSVGDNANTDPFKGDGK